MARSDYESLTREELLTVIERLEAHIAQQDTHIAQQDARILRLEARIQQLEDFLDQATRGGKRQAAPFSKGPPKPDPQKPGRKPGLSACYAQAGEDHGRHAHRAIPASPPDEVIDVPAPSSCPDCGGRVPACVLPTCALHADRHADRREEAVVHQHQI